MKDEELKRMHYVQDLFLNQNETEESILKSNICSKEEFQIWCIDSLTPEILNYRNLGIEFDKKDYKANNNLYEIKEYNYYGKIVKRRLKVKKDKQ